MILDEEHDSSFKQDERLTYQAKEIGYFMMRQHNGLLLLGVGHAGREDLLRGGAGVRSGSVVFPSVSAIAACPGSIWWTSGIWALPSICWRPRTIELLRDVVARGEQAIIMLNRRGYSPLMYCLECGRVAKCPNCEIGLTYHKGRGAIDLPLLRRIPAPFPLICEGCGGCQLSAHGRGHPTFRGDSGNGFCPQAPACSDWIGNSTRRPGRMEEILQAFARREAQVLVGTQNAFQGAPFPGCDPGGGG